MSTVALRIFIGAPFIAIAMLAFSIALLIEWIGDLARTCPHPENPS